MLPLPADLTDSRQSTAARPTVSSGAATSQTAAVPSIPPRERHRTDTDVSPSLPPATTKSTDYGVKRARRLARSRGNGSDSSLEDDEPRKRIKRTSFAGGLPPGQPAHAARTTTAHSRGSAHGQSLYGSGPLGLIPEGFDPNAERQLGAVSIIPEGPDGGLSVEEGTSADRRGLHEWGYLPRGPLIKELFRMEALVSSHPHMLYVFQRTLKVFRAADHHSFSLS